MDVKSSIELSHANFNKENGFSWIVAVSCGIVNLCTNGLLRSQGLLFLATIDTYDVNREAASWPFSLCIASACFSGISVPLLTQIWSPRQILFGTGFLVSLGHVLCYFASSNLIWITICYGVISGIGTGLVTPCLALVINQYFVRHRATGNGISLAGITCGAFIFPNATNALLDQFGLKGTFLVLGGFALNVLVGASFLRPKKEQGRLPGLDQAEIGVSFEKSCSDLDKYIKVPLNDEEKPNLEPLIQTTAIQPETVVIKLPTRTTRPDTVMRTLMTQLLGTLGDPMFAITALSALSSVMVLMVFVMIVVDHAVDIGMSRSRASMLLPVFSLPDLIGRLSTGWISDQGFIKRKNIFMIAKSIAGALLICFPLVRNENSLYAICAVLGLLEGSATILTTVLFLEYLGMRRLVMALGLWSFSIGIVFLATPPLIGLFKDFYGRYDNIFFLMGSTSILSAFVWLAEPIVMNCRAKYRNAKPT